MKLVVAVSCSLFFGCYNGPSKSELMAVRQAAFDHDCPGAQVRVVGRQVEVGTYHFTGYRLDVCGKVRLYRDIGDDRWTFLDVTPQEPRPACSASSALR